ncbi:MAG: hypothetical protein RSF79_18515, partial [Janthinobacterium sp.]
MNLFTRLFESFLRKRHTAGNFRRRAMPLENSTARPVPDHLARQLLAEFPGQCLWGTDWPHPNHSHAPDDAQLIHSLAAIAPSAAALQ